LDGLFGNPSEANSLHVDVEQIEILPDATVLLFAVKRVNNSRLGRFYQPHYWNYLSDENGQSYDLVRDNATYPDWVDAKSHKDVDHYEDEKHAETHIVRPDEVYRFTATYTPLNPGIQHLRLHDSRFGEVDLDKQLFANRVSELVGKANAEPQNLGALLAVAGAYYNAKDYAHAIPWYESAFRIDPRNVNVGNLLSWSYHQTGQFASAEDWNNRLLVLDPRNSTTLFFQGLYRYEAGDKEGAAASWRTVIEIDTGGAASREARAHLASLESEKAALAAPAPSSSPPKQVETEEVPEPPPPKLFYENHPIITKVINRTLLTILGIFVLFVLALFVNVYKEGRSEARASAKRACIPVGSVSVEATKTRFVARERFVVAESPVRISRLSDDFKKWFLGKIEEPFAGSILSYGEHDFVVDRDVVRELGKKKAETTLAEIFSLLKKQGNGEEGPLRTDWHANAFYVRDVNRVLRMVFVGWRNNDWRRKDDNGWHVSTFSFKDGKVRFGTRRIFFRAL
jgi:tetratricopeptide (TPR) repeat protein